MKIYLNEYTKPYLKRLLRNITDTDFVGKMLQDEIEMDDIREKKVADCEHVTGEFVGVKKCCEKCSAMVEKGHMESWTNKNI